MQTKDMVLLAGIKAAETFLNSLKKQLFSGERDDIIDVEIETKKGENYDNTKNTNG